MVRIKKPLIGTLSLKKHTTQISKTDAMIKVLPKLTGLGMPNMKAIIQLLVMLKLVT
ncbi:hypothetical protein [Candidatus Enterovibrio altilux]|uniref:Mobile element protein n=1 Tax=Candidatus Enterovibrio altilux TaxID=1927128 RepID=A0A291BBS5_9GAMM|nr:hypothetical protein [Candidatus Enterovibrio luxaltus]ATF10446.1 Mobile element protein [Candidatus Enterovibrio luxaltus]